MFFFIAFVRVELSMSGAKQLRSKNLRTLRSPRKPAEYAEETLHSALSLMSH
jgi:hypothetical protein